MRRITRLSALCMSLLWLLAGVAMVEADAVSDAIRGMPPCTFACLSTAVVASHCNPDDLSCICPNQQINDQTTACIEANCTIREALIAKNYTSTACHEPVRDKTAIVPWVGMTGFVLVLICVGLRLIERPPWFDTTFGWDDTFIVLATVFAVPFSVMSIPLSQAGLGKDIWKVPFDDITKILKIYFFDEILYITILSFTKISILLFYLRIFKTTTFRYIAWALVGICTTYMVAFDLVFIFQCTPMNRAWLYWDGEHPGTCVDVNVVSWSAIAINIVTDIAIIILPLPQLAKLNLRSGKKAPLLFLFLLGWFVTAISCLRIRYMVEFAKSTNPTWVNYTVGYWSTIEVHLAVIIACMPAIRALVLRMFPVLCCSTHDYTDDYPSGSETLHSTNRGSVITRPSLAKGGHSSFVPLEEHDGRFTPEWARLSDLEMEHARQWNVTKPLGMTTNTEHPWDYESHTRPR